ncbi:MAG: hypothetical protein VW378_02250 [bacterium]
MTEDNAKQSERKQVDSLNRKLGKFKRDSKTKLINLRKKMYYEKPSDLKKQRFADAQRRTRSQQRED